MDDDRDDSEEASAALRTTSLVNGKQTRQRIISSIAWVDLREGVAVNTDAAADEEAPVVEVATENEFSDSYGCRGMLHRHLLILYLL